MVKMNEKYFECEDHKVPSGRKCHTCKCCTDTTDLKEILHKVKGLAFEVERVIRIKEM